MVCVMSEAGVFNFGRAVSSCHHIKHTRYDHQQGAYSTYSTQSRGNTDSFEEWFDKQSREGRMLKYFSLFIELEILTCRLCTFWKMVKLCRWFLAFNHRFFSRWLSVHVAFCTFWYFRCRSSHNFSLVAKDQSHEHSNRQLQAGGGGL